MKLKILIPLLLGSIVFTFVGCGDDIVTPQYGNGQQISSDSNYVSSYTDLGEFIGNEKAKEIALNHANVTNPDYIRVREDYDDGVKYYDVEFRKGRYEYDYEIHKETGRILEFDKDVEDLDD